MIIFGRQNIHCRTLSFDENMEQGYIIFWKSFNSITRFVVLMFSSYFHDWIKVLNLDMSRSEWRNFISISFMNFLKSRIRPKYRIGILYFLKQLKRGKTCLLIRKGWDNTYRKFDKETESSSRSYKQGQNKWT
jgi:hypothetical protein